MSFDGITTNALVHELNDLLQNARIEKINIPNKNEITISFHTITRKNYKLLISIDANNSRLHLTKLAKENPITAPQFCMILRKYLQGGKLLSVTQKELDRIIIFTIENLNDFGDFVKKDLIVELMGKYSNVILVDDEKIIDSMRHVTSLMSSVREVLPNKPYILPSSLGKLNFKDTSFEDFKNSLDKNTNLVQAIQEKYVGISKTFLLGIFESLNFSLEKNVSDFTNNELKEIYNFINKILNDIQKSLIYFKKTANEKDYYILPQEPATLLSEFLDAFYESKEKISILKNAKSNLEREINANITKLKKKLALANEILEDEKNLEKYKKYGELISSNIYKMQLGMDKLVTEDFYSNCELIEIPLAVNLTPSRNAQNYFKKYTKLKNSILHAKEHKSIYESDISYLESVIFNISEAQSLNELDDISEELVSTNIIKKPGKRFKRREAPSAPIKYEKDGIEILVGRNNIQNDRLTFKIAKKTDTWLHTKNIHGSHVIIRDTSPSEEVLYYAAQIAAKHSQAKDLSKIEVDYTLAKFVHKEAGAKPGMVVYTDYKTIII